MAIVVSLNQLKSSTRTRYQICLLFFYRDMVLRNIDEIGVQVEGINSKNKSYADSTVLIAS